MCRCPRLRPIELSVEDHEETLRKLAIRDDAYIDRILGNDRRNLDESSLDEKTHALVRLAGLIAIDAAPPSYMCTVESALAHGATNEEIVGVLVAVMPAVGSPRVVSAAPRLSLALGYDVAAGLEEFGVEQRS
jgi:alkylhydroperoxidase/carboxymuconolactone decarboxylase family protein YurZ